MAARLLGHVDKHGQENKEQKAWIDPAEEELLSFPDELPDAFKEFSSEFKAAKGTNAKKRIVAKAAAIRKVLNRPQPFSWVCV